MTVMPLGSHNLEEGLPYSKGKNDQESRIARFPNLKQKLCSSSRGTQPPPTQPHAVPASLLAPGLLPSLLSATSPHVCSLAFKCSSLQLIRHVIPPACATGQPGSPSALKARHINICYAAKRWRLSQAAAACTLSTGWKDETDQMKALNMFNHEYQVMNRVLDRF